MSVIIGHSSIDENGKISGGKAGDQTTKEVCTRSFYMHSKGWVVLRPVNEQVAEILAQTMEKACANDYIGYDQSQRLTLYDTVKALNFSLDLKDLKVKVECDCSSLIRVCLAYAGIRVGNFTTDNEKAVIFATNQFVEVPCNKDGSNLKRGDILISSVKGHTALVLSNTANGGATVNIELNVLSKGSKGEQVKTLQRLLKSMGYSIGIFGVDGEFGNSVEKAVKKFQKDNNLTQDAWVGEKTWNALLK